jgi:hypothetical protein
MCAAYGRATNAQISAENEKWSVHSFLNELQWLIFIDWGSSPVYVHMMSSGDKFENELEDGYSALLSSGPQSTPPAKEKEETTWKPSWPQPRDMSISKLLLYWSSFEL